MSLSLVQSRALPRASLDEPNGRRSSPHPLRCGPVPRLDVHVDRSASDRDRILHSGGPSAPFIWSGGSRTQRARCLGAAQPAVSSIKRHFRNLVNGLYLLSDSPWIGPRSGDRGQRRRLGGRLRCLGDDVASRKPLPLAKGSGIQGIAWINIQLQSLTAGVYAPRESLDATKREIGLSRRVCIVRTHIF